MDDRLEVFFFDDPEEKRLDIFLVEVLPEFSRSRLQTLIRDGRVTVNGIPAKKSGQMLATGAEVRVVIPPPVSTTLTPEDIPLDVIFENEDVLVVNKPAGMVVHPSAGHETGTLVHAVLAHVPDLQGINGEVRPGVVHRLDKDTSGVIILAKNEKAIAFLQNQFRERTTEKTYLALVDGAPPTPSGRVEAPIGRDPSHRKRMAIRPPGKGRDAASEYRTLDSFEAHTLLAVHPLTGRTHQVRLHCAFLGCPIAGDTLYGRKKPTLPLKRHFLHAFRLKIILPGETTPREFSAPLPDDLARVLEALRSQ
jgi:23S rRNA pseudouridine1911/1915/1917 synthase